MKTDKKDLITQLNIVLDLNSANKKIKANVQEKLKENGIMGGTVKDFFERREIIPLETLTEPTLCLLASALYESEAEEAYRIEPSKFFTDFQIEESKKYKIIKEESNSYPIVFEDVLKFEDDFYVTKISLKQIVDLFSKMVIRYNPETQRPLISKEYGDKIIQEIDLNKTSVQQIKLNIKQGKQITDFITFNVLQGDVPAEIDYDSRNFRLIIKSGDINLIDGFHRCLAGLYAYQENPNIDFSFGLVITNWDVDKSLRFIHQADLKNKLNTSFKKSINPNKLSNSIVKKINESSNSYLSGKLTTDRHQINPKGKLILFDRLSDIIDLEFKPKENVDVVKLNKYLVDGLNLIIENKPELLEETSEILWLSYIVLLKRYYESDNWQKEIINSLNEIDKTKLESISYTNITKSTIKKIEEAV